MLEPRLGLLAERCGIEEGYHDIWGVWHEASSDTVQALLAAMDVTPHPARNGRGEPEAALPDTVVLRRSARGVQLRLPACARADQLGWRVTLEGGEVLQGQASIAALRGDAPCGLDAPGLRTVVLPLPGVPLGYHRLEIAKDGNPLAACLLIVTPDRCHLHEAPGRGQRQWGVALQLYSLRSAGNWGIGDFSDLSTAIAQWAARGAAFVGVNPLHALYLATPEQASPYSPSSRRFLNPLYLNVEAMEDFKHCTAAKNLRRSSEFNAVIESLRAAQFVDYDGVAAAKKRVFELLHAHFINGRSARLRERHAAFGQFCEQGGEALRRFAIFEALHEHFRSLDPNCGAWQQWPEGLRSPGSHDVERFAEAHAGRVAFFRYLQWQSALQLAAARERGRQEGLQIGLYLDLAVSIDRGGADAWANQAVYALRASVGAPPDEFNPTGQDWGLPPFKPAALRSTGYAVFVETLRANMAFAGALRIDHVMGLARLFWVPPETSPAQGAYVRYPLDDLLAIVALESERNRCMVIGEDLGTVPVQLRQALRNWRVLSYRLLMFERDSKGRFQRPCDYPVQSMVAFSTHDLPTLAGYWRSQDEATRKALLAALGEAGLLPEGIDARAGLEGEALSSLSHAVHLYIARSPALLLSVQLEDLAGAAEQANIPGTPDAPPNWRRKLHVSLEDLGESSQVQGLARQLGEARSGTHASPAQRKQ